MAFSRLALGTVQFGMPYGVANRTGQICRDEAALILEHAWRAGVDTLDTAITYGESERRLGEIGVGQWKIVSKLPAIPTDQTNVTAWALESILTSLDRLGIPKLYGLLLHHPAQLLSARGDALFLALSSLKDQGKVEKIGVSIYDPEELDALYTRFRFDIVQAPFNILDRRLATSGWLKRLQQESAEVHVRSVFLQGLMLMELSKRPAFFTRWQSLWVQWHRWLNDHSLSAMQACLGFVMSYPEIERVVVGVDSLGQFREILASAQCLNPAMPPQSLFSEDLDLINPSRWRCA